MSVCVLGLMTNERLSTPQNGSAKTMSFASLTDAVPIAMKQRSTQHGAFIVEMFFKTDGYC
jgi:hypothetical protein